MYSSHVYVLIMFSMSVQCVDFGMLRGVSPNVAAFYNPSRDFNCFDGFVRIPFSHVNDDYCDCLDGSDEPGTSACENSSFHCVNAGYVELKIPSSRVNDGICDCCDGSDEWSTGVCSNSCGALSEAAQAQAMTRAALHSKGHTVRQQMVQAAEQMRLQREERLRKLVEEKHHAEKLKEAAEFQKIQAEGVENAALQKYKDSEEQARREKFRKETREDAKRAHNIFIDLDSNHNDLIELDEVKANQMFDHNRDGEVADDEVKWYLDLRTNEVSEQMFQDSIWPHIKHLAFFETSKEMGHQDEGKDKPTYDGRTRQLVEEANEARSQFESSQTGLERIQHEIDVITEKLDVDYGPEDEYAPLDGQCFSYSDRDYTYTFCPFAHVTQAPKSGGSETQLGRWGHWSQSDDGSPAMVFDKGQSCWKGPQRSTLVLLECSTENAIVSVTEPNKCEYQMQFNTPAACRSESSNQHHEEL